MTGPSIFIIPDDYNTNIYMSATFVIRRILRRGLNPQFRLDVRPTHVLPLPRPISWRARRRVRWRPGFE
jgi:hypothetical protein